MIRVGITATRQGLTDEQVVVVTTILRSILGMPEHSDSVFAHGDCVGGDAQGHQIADMLGYQIEIWPPIIQKNRAFCSATRCKVHPTYDYMTRNRHIVDNSDRMIGCPKAYIEEWRGSGTWAAIRYTRKAGKPLVIVWPDGTTLLERWRPLS